MARMKGHKQKSYAANMLFLAQHGKCFLCGEYMDHPDLVRLKGIGMHPDRPTLDHVVPVGIGGSNEVTNLTLVHERCNNTRGSNPLSPEEKRRHRDISTLITNIKMVKRLANLGCLGPALHESKQQR